VPTTETLELALRDRSIKGDLFRPTLGYRHAGVVLIAGGDVRAQMLAKRLTYSSYAVGVLDVSGLHATSVASAADSAVATLRGRADAERFAIVGFDDAATLAVALSASGAFAAIVTVGAFSMMPPPSAVPLLVHKLESDGVPSPEGAQIYRYRTMTNATDTNLIFDRTIGWCDRHLASPTAVPG
jgi:hypothetical protein